MLWPMIRRTRFVTAALVATTLAIGASATVAGAKSKQPTTKEWANGVCSSIETWAQSVEDTLTSLKDSNSVEDAASNTVDGIKEATDTLVSDLQDLGKPKTDKAKQATKALQKLENQLQDDMQNIEDALGDPGTTSVEVASTFATIGTQLQKAVDQVQAAGDTLKDLGADKEIQKAFESASACKSLKKSL
jgi:gas vesicle protein